MIRTKDAKCFGLVLTLCGALGTAAQAQSMADDVGEFEYMNSCASCHGMSGKGDGPLADLLNTAPPDLTQLQKNNGGVFPVSAAFEMIEGVGDVAAHGSRQMPAWGMRYSERAESGPDFSPGEVTNYPRARILALIEYLSRIQE